MKNITQPNSQPPVPSADDLMQILNTDNLSLIRDLFTSADTLTRNSFGDSVHLRGIVEFSNICRRHCAYCGIGAHNPNVTRYRMSQDEILAAIDDILAEDIHTVVLQSGEDPLNTPQWVEGLIRSIRKRSDIAITLSLGEYSQDTYKRWVEAGADRYLLKFETANPVLYKALHPDCDFFNRFDCLDDLRRAGFQLGSGFMVGLPGQSLEDLARDLLKLQELGPDMAGIGPFISHPMTPLKNAPGGDPLLALKTVALARHLMPKCYLPTTTALETVEHDSRIRGLSAGANVIMPNFTPRKYKELYELYPDKSGSHTDLRSSLNGIYSQITAAGKEVMPDRGDSLLR